MILFVIPKVDRFCGLVARPGILFNRENPKTASMPPKIPSFNDGGNGGDDNENVSGNSQNAEKSPKNKISTLQFIFGSFLASSGLSFLSHKTEMLDNLDLGESAQDILKGTVDSLTASLGVLSLTSYFGKFPKS